MLAPRVGAEKYPLLPAFRATLRQGSCGPRTDANVECRKAVWLGGLQGSSYASLLSSSILCASSAQLFYLLALTDTHS